MRKERITLGCQGRDRPGSSALAIQLDAYPLFQSQQPIADPLLGDEQASAASRRLPLRASSTKPPPGRWKMKVDFVASRLNIQHLA